MTGSSVEDELAARVSDDPGDDSERRLASASTGPCSTCSSRKADGSGSPAATSARLPMQPTSSPRKTTTEPASDALDRLDRGDDPERTVEPTALRNRVEVRPDPDQDVSDTCSPDRPGHVRRGCRGGRPRPRDRHPRATTSRAGALRPRRASRADGSLPDLPRSRTARRGARGPARAEPSSASTGAVSTRRRAARRRRPRTPRATTSPRRAPRRRSGRRSRCRRARSAAGRSPPRCARGPASSAAAVKDSPFHAIERPPASAIAGTSSQTGPLASTRRGGDHDRDRDADAEQRSDARSDDVGPAADPIRSADREHLRRRRPRARPRLSESPCSSCRKTTANPSTASCA